MPPERRGKKETSDDWKKQYRVYLRPTIYTKIKGIARIREMTIEEWVDEALRKAAREAPEATEALLRSIHEAPKGDMPEVGIEQMLKEIELGYLDNGYLEE
jgi:hypothetical protein